MKILIFNWRDIKNPEAGGAEVFTHENAKRWVKNGNEVTLFTSEFKGCDNKEVIDGVRIIRAGTKYSVYRKAKGYYKRYFSKEGFDVVIDEINTRPFLTPKFVNKGEKIIALIHQLAREYWWYETPFPIDFMGYYFLENKWLRNYGDIPTVTVSESTKRDLLDLGFKNVMVVPEGLNFKPPDNANKKEENPVVIYVGRLKRAKRPDHAIKAFEMVKKEMPEAHLWIVGDGYLRKDLENGACDGVTFFGYVSEREKIELLSKAWVLVNPSVREGWGINIIEANACGTPCIAYDVPGLRDSIIDEETGILVEENGNVKRLAETMMRVLEDKELREKLSTNALMHSKSFSWHKSAVEFLKAIGAERPFNISA
jgi:glycosyltransferase involved in cell wall biosynthesis